MLPGVFKSASAEPPTVWPAHASVRDTASAGGPQGKTEDPLQGVVERHAAGDAAKPGTIAFMTIHA